MKKTNIISRENFNLRPISNSKNKEEAYPQKVRLFFFTTFF